MPYPTYFNSMTNPYNQGYQQYQTPPTYQQGGTEMIWVENEEMAKSYLVAPNSTVVLWDKNTNTIYLKSADGSGMPTMRILDYKDRTAEPAPTTDEYVKRQEFDEFIAKIEKRLDTGAKKKGAAKDE